MIPDVPLGEELRAKVTLTGPAPDGRRRLGKVAFRVDPDTFRATCSVEGTTIASAVIVGGRSFGSRGWELTMDDGSAWVVTQSGCSCGG